MKTFFFSSLLVLLFGLKPEDKLTGRWESRSETGAVTGVVFKTDNSFDSYLNRKHFVSGTYTLNDSLFTIQDDGCKGLEGVYRISFYSNNDSIRLQLISDSCKGRSTGMPRLHLGRTKKDYSQQ
jgi:hypothetical protein